MIPTCGLSAETQEAIKSVLKKYPIIEKAILYGSRATGQYKNGSDIDMVLIAPNGTLSDLFAIEQDLDDLMLPYKIDLSFYHLIENEKLLEHISSSGKDF